jgi:hypothetical protein
MSETPSSNQEKKPIVTEVDPDFYNRLCKVVKAGTFKSIEFSPWHKGCDIEFDATCRWPELKDLLEEWYYDRLSSSDLDEHTSATFTPYYDGEELTFSVDAYMDYGRDSDISEGWETADFQEFVYNLLPEELKKETDVEDVWVSLDVDYESPDKASITNLSISIDGKKKKDFAGDITPENQILIRDHVISWCLENIGVAGEFSVAISQLEVETVFSSFSEEFLLVPAQAEGKKA